MTEIQLTNYRVVRSGDQCIWFTSAGREMCRLRISNIERVCYRLEQLADQMKGTKKLEMPMPDESTPVTLSAVDVELLVLGLKGWEQDSVVRR